MLFNHLAREKKLQWRAISRGLAVGSGVPPEVGAISRTAAKGLRSRGVRLGFYQRPPMQVKPRDFARADRMIALDEQEHRPYMKWWFPEWADKVEYWQVGDLHSKHAEAALRLAAHEVRALVDRLSGHHSGKAHTTDRE
jgi:protein-tyrosine phosphatase